MFHSGFMLVFLTSNQVWWEYFYLKMNREAIINLAIMKTILIFMAQFDSG